MTKRPREDNKQCEVFAVTVANPFWSEEKKDWSLIKGRLTTLFSDIGKNYIFQGEITRVEDHYNPHIQGYIRTKKRIREGSLASQIRITVDPEASHKFTVHAARCSTDGISRLKSYCMKSDTRDADFGEPIRDSSSKLIIPFLVGKPLRTWQSQIISTLRREPDDRSILWVCDPVGQSGKSKLVQYLELSRGFMTLPEGSARDVMDSMFRWVDSNGDPKGIVFDIPRSYNVSGIIDMFRILEKCKDQNILGTKFQGCRLNLPMVHVIVFSNTLPKLGVLSSDRWRLSVIRNNVLQALNPAEYDDVLAECTRRAKDLDDKKSLNIFDVPPAPNAPETFDS